MNNKYLFKFPYLFSIALIILVIFTFAPISNKLKFPLNAVAIALIYIVILINSVNEANSVLKIIWWLLFYPIVISVFVSIYVSIFWHPIITQDKYFIPLFLVAFFCSWMFASYAFDYKKVKLAITILNAFFATIVTLAFLTTLDSNLITSFFSSETISLALHSGLSINSLIEVVIKFITFPYVISVIWAQVILELRSSKHPQC